MSKRHHDNGTLDGASVQGENPYDSSAPSTFEEQYADKILNAQAVGENSDGLEQRVSELESLMKSMAGAIIALKEGQEQ